MRISIEWFLLDNALMNAVTLMLAAALSGLRLRGAIAIVLCVLGAVFALLALSVWPLLLTLLPKLAFAGVLALGLRFDGWQGYARGTLSVLICAMLLGGLMLSATLLWPESASVSGVAGGVVVSTVALRAALIAVALAAMTPRMLRRLRTAARMREGRVALRLTMDERQMEVIALLDTGNLLTEPITGLPVLLLNRCPAFEAGFPVRYCSMGGEGELIARRARRAQILMDGAWRDMDVMIAHAPQYIAGADALLGSGALPSPYAPRPAKNRGRNHGA